MYSTPATFKEPPFQVSPYESVKEIVTAEPTIQLPSQSTVAVAKELALRCKDENSKVVVGGGDTIYGINIAGTYEDYTHVSTGGGAFLQWLEGKDLPAVEAILNKH